MCVVKFIFTRHHYRDDLYSNNQFIWITGFFPSLAYGWFFHGGIQYLSCSLVGVSGGWNSEKFSRESQNRVLKKLHHKIPKKFKTTVFNLPRTKILVRTFLIALADRLLNVDFLYSILFTYFDEKVLQFWTTVNVN